MALDPGFRDCFFYILGMFLTHLFASGNNLVWWVDEWPHDECHKMISVIQLTVFNKHKYDPVK